VVRQRGTVRAPSCRGGGAPALAVAAAALALLLLVTSAAAIFGEPETISPEGVPASEPQIDADERGNAIAVWTAGEEGALEVQARFRPAAGPWGAVETLSVPGEDSSSPQVVFDERHNALVAWTSFQTSQADPPVPVARVRASFRPKGGGFGPSQVVHEEAGSEAIFFQPQLAIDESAALVWTRATPDGTTVQAAFRPKGGSFGPAQDLATGGFDPDVAVDERGNAIVVATGESLRVVSSFKPRTGPFGAVQPISQGDGFTPRVATDEDSNAIAVWDTGGRIEAAYRRAGGSFGAGRTLSDPGLTAFDPDVAFDDEDAVIAWAAGDESGSQIQTVTHTERGALTTVQTLSEPGGEAFEPQVAAEDGAAIVWTRNLRVQGAFRAEHKKSFGSARTMSVPRLDAFEPDAAMDDDSNVFTVWTIDANPDPELNEPQIQFSFRPAENAYTEPAPVSTPGQLAFGPRIATDERNNALAVWVEDDVDGTDRVRAAFRPAGFGIGFTPFGTPLSPDGSDASEPQVVFDERGNALVVWVRADPEGDGDSQVESSVRPRGGSFGAARLISSAADGVATFGVRLAIDESATAVWSEFEGLSLRAMAAFRPKGGSFAAPVRLSATDKVGFEPDVAMDEHGDSVVTWTEANDLLGGGGLTVMWASKPRTKAFGPAARLSPSAVEASGGRVATDDHDNAIAVWVAGDGEPVVQSAFRRDGRSFGSAQTISEPGADEPQVVFDERRNALAVWTRFVGDQGQIEAAFRPRYGSFGAPEVISPVEPDVSHFGPEVAINESAAIVWTRADAGGTLRILAAFRPKGGIFGAVEALSDRDLFGFGPHVAVDERGNSLAVWTETDAVDPAPPSMSLVQFAFRARN
jgi:hypothetical protein